MKITLTEKKEVINEVEIETPAYFKGADWFYKIDEDKITYVNPSATHCGIWNKGKVFYENYVSEALKAPRCTHWEYSQAIEKFLENLLGKVPELPEISEHESIGNDLTQIDD